MDKIKDYKKEYFEIKKCYEEIKKENKENLSKELLLETAIDTLITEALLEDLLTSPIFTGAIFEEIKYTGDFFANFRHLRTQLKKACAVFIKDMVFLIEDIINETKNKNLLERWRIIKEGLLKDFKKKIDEGYIYGEIRKSEDSGN